MDNKELIWAHEREFAARLASQVMVKPKLSTWMILIPFIFIFYFQDFSRYKKKRAEFMDNWLLSRKRVLSECETALDEGRKPDLAGLAQKAHLKDKAKGKFKGILDVMAPHYTLLLKASGDTFEDLLRSAYDNERGEFLFYLNRLQDAEKALNKSLLPRLKADIPEVGATIKKIEKNADRLRRKMAGEIFTA